MYLRDVTVALKMSSSSSSLSSSVVVVVVVMAGDSHCSYFDSVSMIVAAVLLESVVVEAVAYCWSPHCL